MGFAELLIIAVGLSMDAFAVAVGKGLSMRRITFKNMLIVGLYFGVFQAVMPMLGYLLGVQFQNKITAVDHWIAFALLCLIGLKMIKESKKSECCKINREEDASLHFLNMVGLAIATSIDALAVGVTFAFLRVSIIPAVCFIGVVTLLLSMLGVKIGNVFGSKYQSRAEFAGGVILVCMGLKILLEHTGVI